MDDTGERGFGVSALKDMRKKWTEPDRDQGHTWEFDGVPYEEDHGDWMNYDHEMRDGLSELDCKTFDDLVSILSNRLGRKPNVIDLMGGGYFLRNPENAAQITGIRIHNKDKDFLAVHKEGTSKYSQLVRKIIGAANRRVVDGDVLSSHGWKVIKNENLPAADLLVCRPVGPFDNKHAMGSMFDDPASYGGLYRSLFFRMLALVNKKSGTIFTEVPDIFPDAGLRSFFEDIDSKKGCKTKLYTVPDEDYSWGGKKRRYVVVQFGQT